MSNSCLQCGWFLWPLNTPSTQTPASTFGSLFVEREGQARFALFAVLLHLTPQSKRKEKLRGHKSIVYRGSHFPLSSVWSKKNICFARGSRGQVFPLSRTVTQAGRGVGVPGAGGFQRRWCVGPKPLAPGCLITPLCGSKPSAASPICLMKQCMQNAWLIEC